MSWLKQTISQLTEANSSSVENDKHHSKNDMQDLVQKFQKLVSNLRKDDPPDQCIKFYMENFHNLKQKRLSDLQIQSDVSRIVRHLVYFIDKYIDDVNLAITAYYFLNSVMSIYSSSTRTDAAYFTLFIKASETENIQIIEAALPYINSCLQFNELISLFFSGDELVSIWSNIYIGSQNASDYIGSMINMSLTNMESIPHMKISTSKNSPQSSFSPAQTPGSYYGSPSTLVISSRVSPLVGSNSPISDDLSLITPFLEKVYQDINNDSILPSLAPRAFMFLGLIIKNINTGDFLPSICENIHQMSPNLDNLDFLEPFIKAQTSDPLAIWSLIDAICADPKLRIELLISALNAIHNSGVTPTAEVFSFNSFIPRISELSDQYLNVLFDVISSSEIAIKADFFCEATPLSQTGIKTKYLNKVARGAVWGDVFCDNIIDCFLIKPDFDEIKSYLTSDKYFVAITECLISQIRYQSQYVSILFKIFSKIIIETSSQSICHIFTLLLCRTNPNHYMNDVIEFIGSGNSNELILSIFSFTSFAVRRFAKIFLKHKGIDVLGHLFTTKAGINFLASLVVDGPYKKIDDYIYENFNNSPLKKLPNSQLIKLMMGVSQDTVIEQEKAKEVKTSSSKGSTLQSKKALAKGLLRIPSLCAFVKDVPLLSPYDMYIYGSHATQYFTPTDEQIKSFSSYYIPKNLLNKVMTNWEEMTNLTRINVDNSDVLQFHQEPDIQLACFSASKLHPNNYKFPYSTEQNCSIQMKHSPSISFWFKILNMPNIPTTIASFDNFHFVFNKNGEIAINNNSLKCEINKWHLASFVLSEKPSPPTVMIVYFDGKHFCDLNLNHQILSTFTFGDNPANPSNPVAPHHEMIHRSNTEQAHRKEAKIGHSSSGSIELKPLNKTSSASRSFITVKSDWLLIPFIHTSQNSLHHSDIKNIFESGPGLVTQKRLKPANTVRLVHYRGVLKQMHLFGGPIFVFQEMMKTTIAEQFQMQLIVAFNLYKLGFFSRTLFFSLLRYTIRKHLNFAKPSEMFIINEFSGNDGFNWKDFSLVMNDAVLLASPTFKGRVLTKTMLYMQPNYEDLRIFYQAIDIFSLFNIDQETMNNMLTILSLYLEKNPAKRSLLVQRLLLNVITLPFFDSDDAFALLYDSRVERKQKLLLELLTRDKQHFMQTLSFKLAINHLQMMHSTLAVEFFFYLSELVVENRDYFDLSALESVTTFLCTLADKEKFWVAILRMLFEFSGSNIKKFMKKNPQISSLKIESVKILMELLSVYIPFEYEQMKNLTKEEDSQSNTKGILSIKILQAIQSYINTLKENSSLSLLIRSTQNLCSLGFGKKEWTDYPFKIRRKSNADNENASSDNEDENSASTSTSKNDDGSEVSISDEEIPKNLRKRSSSGRTSSAKPPSSTKPSSIKERPRIGSIGKRFSKPEISPVFSDIENTERSNISPNKSIDFSAIEINSLRLVTQELEKMEPQLCEECFKYFSNHPVDAKLLSTTLFAMFSKNTNSILYQKETNNDEKAEIISKDLNVDIVNNEGILNSQQAQIIATIAAKLLCSSSNDPVEFKKDLLKLTIYGSDVDPKVASEMHKKVILTLIGENKISLDSLWILIEFLVPRIIEGWWDTPNMLARLFILVTRNATIYHESLRPFIFICFYELSSKNPESVEYLKQMGYALFGWSIIGILLDDNHFYQSIIHILLSSQIQYSSDGSTFFLFIIEQIHKLFDSPHLLQFKEIIENISKKKKKNDYDPNLDPFKPVEKEDTTKSDEKIKMKDDELLPMHEWIEQNKNHYNVSYLSYHKDVLRQTAHNYIAVKNERNEISFKERSLVTSEYIALIIKEITEIRRVFRYQFFTKVNRSSVFLERAINALFKNKEIVDHSISTKTSKVALVPGPHPLVVPTKLVPMLFEYEAPYKKTSEQVEVPQSITSYPELNSDLKELQKPVIGPKCLEGYGLPCYIKHPSIYSIFKSRFNGISEPFLCYFLLAPEILRCVGVLSNNNIHIMLNASVSNGTITLIDKVMLCHYPVIENAMYGLYGESSLFLSHVVLNISFSSITLSLPRTYIYEPVALDLFTSYGCHFSLSMNQSIRNSLLEKIQVKPVSNSKRGVLFANRLMSKKFDEVMKLWKNNHLSNYDYLLYLNIVSGRSFNDFSQYPVFPWVIGNYTTENPTVLRDLSKPMGQQTNKRTDHYDQIFKETKQSYFYGTHYSYPTSVMYFLMRIEPCTLYNVLLHSGFDHPDRQFFSIHDSYRSASEVNQADVRELIPELYSLPELLQNVNKIELQKRTTGVAIDNVVLPPWAQNDPNKFIWQMRAALECPEVTKLLPLWIDLIFGYKQRGKAAVEAKNLFHPITYNTFVKEKDSEFYQAQKESIINFGQCPLQLLRETSHPQKFQRTLNSLDNMDVRECIIKHLPRYIYHIRIYDNELIPSSYFSMFLGNPPVLVHVYDGYITVKGELIFIDQLFDPTAVASSSENTILTIATGAGIVLNYYFDQSGQNHLVSSSVLPQESFITCAVSGHYGLYCAATKNEVFMFDLASGFLMKKVQSKGAVSLIEFDEVHDFIITVSDLQITVYSTNLVQIAHKDFAPPEIYQEVTEKTNENVDNEIQIDESQEDKEESDKREENDNEEEDENLDENEEDEDNNDNNDNEENNNRTIENTENTENTETDNYTDNGIQSGNEQSNNIKNNNNNDDEQTNNNNTSSIVKSPSRNDHLIPHVNNCVTSLTTVDSTIWYPIPFFVTGHNDGSVYLWQVFPVENKLKPLCLLSHKLKNKITALKIFRRNQAIVCCDVKGNAETISVEILMKNLLKPVCFDKCSSCLESFENEDHMNFCSLCGLPYCKKCLCESNSNLCKICEAKDATTSVDDSSIKSGSVDQDML